MSSSSTPLKFRDPKREKPYHLETKAVITNYFEKAIDEIDAIVCLLGMARKAPISYGYDANVLDEIMLRRVRRLSRACQNTVSQVLNDETPCEPEQFPWEDQAVRED